MLGKSRSILNPEFGRLFRHLVFGSILIFLMGIVLLEILVDQHDMEVMQNKQAISRDLSLALALTGDIPAGSSRDEWSKLLTVTPQAGSKIPRIVLNTKWDTTQGEFISVYLPESLDNIVLENHTLNNVELFEGVVYQFLSSTKLTEEVKANILANTCCFNVSDNINTLYKVSGVSHLFIEGDKDIFIWKMLDDTISFIELNHNGSHGLVPILIAAFIIMFIVLVMVYGELLHVDGRLAQKGVNLMNGSGVLRELTYSYDPSFTDTQRLLAVQREMINAISHELRTPIARLRFGLEVAKDEAPDLELITIDALENDIEELNSLVDEVLTYGRLEEGSLKLHFEEVSIKKLIDNILQHNALLLSHLSIEASVDANGCVVVADIHHLHRALQNLILNAGKYANSLVRISFEQNDESWEVSVEDDGPGIKPKDRDKIFIPFHRLDDSRTRASGGYGLGLAIVQRVAFWHGGQVKVDSGKIGGSKFCFVWSKCCQQKA